MHEDIAERLAWVAVDWGSSQLRAWGLDERGEVLARGGSAEEALAHLDRTERALLARDALQ